jgi:phage gp29-like protein
MTTTHNRARNQYKRHSRLFEAMPLQNLPQSIPFESSATPEIATRATRGEPATFGALPNPDRILRQIGRANTEYDNLLTDPHLYALVQVRRGAIAELEWEVQANGADQRVVEAVRFMLNALNITALSRQFVDAALFGYSVYECLWHEPTASNPFIMPSVTAKPRDWFAFDGEGNLLFRSAGNPLGTVVRRFSATNAESSADDTIPQRAFLVPRNNPTLTNPYGEAVLARCYWNVFFKQGGKKMFSEFVERFGFPWVIAEHAQGAQDDVVQEMVDNLAMMNQGGVYVAPEGSGVKLESQTNNDGTLFVNFLADSRTETAMVVVGNPAIVAPTPGRLGGEDAAQQTASWVTSNDRSIVESTWNELICWFCEINFGVAATTVPTLRLYQAENVDSALTERDKNLYALGVRFTKEYIAATYNIQPNHIALAEEDEL